MQEVLEELEGKGDVFRKKKQLFGGDAHSL